MKGGSSLRRRGNRACRKLVTAAAHPPDICVPNCDAQDRCPPNHFCFSKLSGSGSPPICLPGLLGFLCESDIDCMVGKCISDNEPDEGLRLNLCTVPCGNDDDCEKFDSDQGKFVCQLTAPAASCATPDAYRGARCYDDADCTRDEGTSCVFSSKPTSPTDQGTCSRLCPGGTGRARRAAASATSACRSRSRATARRSPAATPATSACPAPPTTAASA